MHRRHPPPLVEAHAVSVGEEQELLEGGDGRKGHRRGFALSFGFRVAFVFSFVSFFDFFRDHVDVDVEVRDGQEAQVETAYGGVVEVESQIARKGGVVDVVSVIVVGADMVADAGVQRRRRGQKGGIQGDVADAAQIGQVAGVGSTSTSSRSTSSPSRGEAMVMIAGGDEDAAAAAAATTSPRRDVDLAEGQIRDAVAAAAGAVGVLLAADVVVEFGSQLGEQERGALGDTATTMFLLLAVGCR